MLAKEIEFKKDYLDGMKTKHLKKKYHLSNREFRNLTQSLKLKRGWERGHHHNRSFARFKPKNYFRVNNGGYVIQKSIEGKTTYFGYVPTEEEARYVVKHLNRNGWVKSEAKRVILKLKGKRND